jgi:ABC-type amino acid transport system permease subunit
MFEFLPLFILGFLDKFKTNLGIAFIALLVGLFSGAILGFMQSKEASLSKSLASPVISFLRAFPTFVLMFVLWNFMPRTQNLTVTNIISDQEIILIFALSAYSISSLSDVIADALHFRYLGDTQRSWLVIPNIFRIYVTLVLTTSIGAAIGVNEAVTYSLIFSDGLVNRSEKIVLLMTASVLFAVFFTVSRLALDQITEKIKIKQN